MFAIQAIQSLLDEEFPGIKHIHTSTLHKKVTNARHDFLRLSGTENKLESLIQASFLLLSCGWEAIRHGKDSLAIYLGVA